MDGLGNDLKRAVVRSGIEKQVATSQVIEYAQQALEQVLGDDAEHIRPQYVKNRTLTVTCDSAAVAQQLKMNEPAILAAITTLDTEQIEPVERIRYLL